jgi:preprotein translocase subunit SecE
MVEHFLGKEEVGGSIPLISSLLAHGRSSIGRAAVSKTVGYGFNSCRPCNSHAAELLSSRFKNDAPLPIIQEPPKTRKTMIESLKTFVEDVQKEMKKVSWPTREQLREATTVVIVICLIITVFVYLVDTGMTLLMQTIF